ncbi:GFA family protein [Sphingosinicella sp. CPCC 101087]|uniref:GFA family protein n=1 Tax=Sphingosinicella sp. CPCC 101087 TaxID=2497754 RepID=UPI00101BF0BF|nr:GFA family protein [Sphingosinicella sp. CPCC 101087]
MHEGGCECGRVRYRLTSGPIFVNGCHCRQCQKLSGSAFAINAMIEADRVELIAGGDVIGPDGTAACPDCATMLWALHPQFGDRIRFVRVGTLDEGERLPPDAHFFVRSRHPWIVLPTGVPSFETLPGPDDPPLHGPDAQARLDAALR